MRPIAGFLVVLPLVLAGCADKGARYPDSYILYENELPAELGFTEVPPEVPFHNPGEIPAAFASEVSPEFQDLLPDRLWAELLEVKARPGEGGLAVGALYYADEAKIDAAIAQIGEDKETFCANKESEDAAGAVYRDGNVVVVIMGDDTMRSYVDVVIQKIRAKAPGLVDMCA